MSAGAGPGTGGAAVGPEPRRAAAGPEPGGASPGHDPAEVAVGRNPTGAAAGREATAAGSGPDPAEVAGTPSGAEPDAEPLDVEGWTCPAPLRTHPSIVMGHGGGGRMSAELVEHLFLPEFDPPSQGASRDASSDGTVDSIATPSSGAVPLAGVLRQLGDAAVLRLGGDDLAGARLAFTTDSYVVRPRFFPGGNVGDLAVNGTINDLAVSGAVPLALSVGLILEEGMPLDELGVITRTMARAARRAGVSIVTGDTKVVDAGHGDGVYINTAGIGLVPAGLDLGPHRVAPGDRILVSGPIGAHGIAVLSVRDGLEFGSSIVTDSAPLHGLVGALRDAGIAISMMRDPTRGGLAATLNEIAGTSGTGIEIVERAVPVPEDVRAACGFLGLDPMQVANEGKLVAFVSAHDAERALEVVSGHPLGAGAALIGEVVAAHPGVVVARTAIGGTRVVDLPLAEQLPRIC